MHRQAPAGPPNQETIGNGPPESATIRYDLSQDEYVDFTDEFKRPGDVITWSELPEASHDDREILMTTNKGDHYFIKGKTLYNLTASQAEGTLRVTAYEHLEDLPAVTIGQPWRWTPELSTDDPVVNVEVLKDYLHRTEPGLNSYAYDKTRGNSPFDKVYEILEKLGVNLNENQPEPEPAPEPEPEPEAEPEPTVDQPTTPEVFSHDQAFLPWFRRNRWPGLKKLLKARKLGAFAATAAAVGVDYLSVNTINTDLYSKRVDAESKDNGAAAIRELGASLHDARLEAAKNSGYKRSALWRDNNLETSRSQEITAQIETYNEQFHDPTYVPTTDEYKEMLNIADSIYTYHVNRHPELPGHGSFEENRVGYSVLGGGPDIQGINANTARSFLDAVQGKRWKLSDESLEDAEMALKAGLRHLRALQRERRRESRDDFLNYDEYREYLAKRKKTRGAVPDNVLDPYRYYLERRLDLDAFVHDMEAES